MSKAKVILIVLVTILAGYVLFTMSSKIIPKTNHEAPAFGEECVSEDPIFGSALDEIVEKW